MIMDRELTDRLAFEIKDPMAAFVSPFVTPISRSDSPEYGWAWGTGAYAWVESTQSAFLLTNEHVAHLASTELLAHLPRPGAEYEAIVAPFHSWPKPIDFACTPIDMRGLSDDRDCLASDQFESSYNPVPNELLFWIGHPGSRADRKNSVSEHDVQYSWAGELSVAGVPMVSQALADVPDPAPEWFDSQLHVLIHYPFAAQQTLQGPKVELRNPHGLSGTLIWDSKRIACHWAGVDWQPESARVCGMLWATSEKQLFTIATRVEHIRTCLDGLVSPVA